MLKILFLIPNLSHGGAEKVLVNLVNNMDKDTFDITVMVLFGGGINEQFLKPHIKLIKCLPFSFRGNSHILKLFTPEYLHKLFIKDTYDIEVSYLEGVAARIISGCKNPRTKLVSWIHITQQTKKMAAKAFRNYRESLCCYKTFHATFCVSEEVKNDFLQLYDVDHPVSVLYNVNESDFIKKSALEPAPEINQSASFSIIGVGKVIPNKGFFRLARIHKRLVSEGLNLHSYVLGVGNQQRDIECYLEENNLSNSFTFLGYQVNPYKFVAKCDLFVCTSFAEGFSTAATEALIVGTPVCTTRVSGMEEMLGKNNEYGIIVDTDEELYQVIKQLILNQDLYLQYKNAAQQRGLFFNKENCINNTQDALLSTISSKE